MFRKFFTQEQILIEESVKHGNASERIEWHTPLKRRRASRPIIPKWSTLKLSSKHFQNKQYDQASDETFTTSVENVELVSISSSDQPEINDHEGPALIEDVTEFESMIS